MIRRVVGTLGLVALGAAGLGLATGFAQAHTAAPQAANAANATTKITVAASEFKFVFSKRSIPATGTVIFTVVNKGKISHDFKIAGKKTPTLNPGQSAKLTVKFTKKGHFPYLCTIPGHAAAGMKGTFSVAVKAVAPPPPPSTTTTTAPPPTTTTSTVPVGTGDTKVTVNMVEYAFQLSQSTMPSGKITFTINNKGNEVHNFAILGGRAGAQIAPGTSETWSVSLPPGTYNYQCDVPFHASFGMVGQFTVTP